MEPVFLSIVLAAIAFWMLRAAKHEEMQELWNRKWKTAEEAAQQNG